jgi:hypothetical protein
MAGETAAPLVAEATANRPTPARNSRRRPNNVGQTSAQKQQAASHHHVAVDDPSQACAREVEVVLDVRQRAFTIETSTTRMN